MKVKRSQCQTPLFEEMTRYARHSLISFHTPGHKAGRGLETEWMEIGFPATLDLTEISAFNWDGARERAEELAAEFFRSDRTFFLTQGASQGIIGGMLGAFSPGDIVLVGRNCHSSVIKGIILTGLTPIYLEAEFLPEFNIPIGINPDSLQRRIKEYPHAKGLIITNPSYQGVADHLQFFREIIANRILFVDEAHGGYLNWTGFTGYDAYHYADIWVQGTHKMLGSLTQTGLLHLKTERIDPIRVQMNLNLITSTSPSYILLASLDSNRRWLALNGAGLFREKLAVMQDFKAELAKLSGLQVLTAEKFAGTDKLVDPWKLSIQFHQIGLTGYQADAILREKYRIQSEYADLAQVTFLMTPWQAGGDFDQLQQALGDISVQHRHQKRPIVSEDLPGFIPQLIMRPRDAGLDPGQLIPLARAVGRISAAIISPYPPGIPLLAPGELIGATEVEYLQKILANHGVINGVNRDGMIRVTQG